MAVLRGNVLEINPIDFGGHVQIPLHPGHGYDEIHLFAGEFFNLPQPLLDLEQPGPAGDFPGLQGGRHRKADGAVATALVRHHKVGSQRVKAAVYALYRGVIAF